VIHVRDEGSIDEAATVEKMVDAILLDSGNPSLENKELGVPAGRTTGATADKYADVSKSRCTWRVD
jgi:hypothetical protein